MMLQVTKRDEDVVPVVWQCTIYIVFIYIYYIIY